MGAEQASVSEADVDTHTHTHTHTHTKYAEYATYYSLSLSLQEAMMRYIEHFPSFEATREQKVLVVSYTHTHTHTLQCACASAQMRALKFRYTCHTCIEIV